MNKVDGIQQLKTVFSSLYSLLHEMFFECLLQLLRWCSGKEYTCKCRRYKRWSFHPWVGKIPWRRKWQLTPVFWPGELHGQRSLVDYSSWGRKEWDVTEPLSLHEYIYTLTHAHTHTYIYSTSLNNSLDRYLINNLLK